MPLHLKPQNDVFFEYFEESSEAICEGAKILREYVTDDGDSTAHLELLNEIEARGDEVFLTTIQRLNKSFITPFEREDIYVLARELNGIIDYIHGTMEKMVLYKTGEPRDPNIRILVETLEKAAIEIRNAVYDLKSLKKNYYKVLEACDKIRKYEHEGDFLYRSGIALLFETTEDVVEIIKWKEIFEHLETALDHCEDLSNVLKGVAVKYV